MTEKWIDRGKDAAPSLLTPKALELAHSHAQEQRERAERAESEVALVHKWLDASQEQVARLERRIKELEEQLHGGD